MRREFADVHDAHCCPRHGCKYGDKDCTVESGKYPGLVCEICDMMREETQAMTEADLERMVDEMTELQQMILLRLLEKNR